MSIMIHDNLGNIRFRNERPHRRKVLWNIVAPAASQISKQLFLVFEGSRAPSLAHRWVKGLWNTGLALQKGHTNVRNIILLFLHWICKTSIFLFLGVNVFLCFTEIDKSIFFQVLLHYMVHVKWLKTWKAENTCCGSIWKVWNQILWIYFVYHLP